MTIDSQIISHIHELADYCKYSLQRRMVVLSGSEDWCFKLVNDLSNINFLVVSHNKNASFEAVQAPEKLNLILGREYDNILWDGFSGLNPDALGIASGLLKYGGFFLLLLPPFDYLKTNADNDYSRMCSETFSINDCHTFFLQRLVDHLQKNSQIAIFEEGKSSSLCQIATHKDDADKPSISLPTSDQVNAIQAIKTVAFGHRNRPLVLEAHRGRGKSSALGIAAAEIYIEKKLKTTITAPSKKTCEAAFKHYKERIKSSTLSQLEKDEALAAFQFIPIDIMLSHHIDCHLLFIDEAAAIPTSSLNSLSGKFTRVIYSTTTHGYEGNGQGFAIRFKATLDKHYPQWKSLSLNTPIRWLEDDLLEPWFFHFLLLDASLPHISNVSLCSLKTERITQKELFDNDALFEQIISLLVTAHYQTSPSDLRLILDHPKVNILITRNADNTQTLSLYGVCLIIEEGSIHSSELAHDIISGKRRPRGHLFPQALCASSASPEFLSQSTYRIMRIAVHPSMQNKGIGSNLLSTLREYANDKHIDSLSTSYGLSQELLSFWNKNQFKVVKLGSKVDGASGLRSIMMMQALSGPAHLLLKKHSPEFLRLFIFNLNRLHQTLPASTVSMVLRSLSIDIPSSPVFNSSQKISAFAHASRPLEDTSIVLFEWLLDIIPSAEWDNLSEDKKTILITQILQDRDYKVCLEHLKLDGKKQLLTALRGAVKSLLTHSAH